MRHGMNQKMSTLGKFSSPVAALHKANRRRFEIADMQKYNQLLLGGNGAAAGTINDHRCFSGTAYLQERKGKAFGNFVETEAEINGERAQVIVKVRKDLAGLSDRILLFRHRFMEGNPLMPLQDRKGNELVALEGIAEVFVSPASAPKAVFARRRYGLDFFLDDRELLRLFTSDEAAFGLLARCLDFFGGRGAVGDPVGKSKETLAVFGKQLKG